MLDALRTIGRRRVYLTLAVNAIPLAEFAFFDWTIVEFFIYLWFEAACTGVLALTYGASIGDDDFVKLSAAVGGFVGYALFLWGTAIFLFMFPEMRELIAGSESALTFLVDQAELVAGLLVLVGLYAREINIERRSSRTDEASTKLRDYCTIHVLLVYAALIAIIAADVRLGSPMWAVMAIILTKCALDLWALAVKSMAAPTKSLGF